MTSVIRKENDWMEGTQLLAVVLKRLAGSEPVVVTKAEVEALAFGTSHPVVFTMVESFDRITMQVVHPHEPSSDIEDATNARPTLPAKAPLFDRSSDA